MKLHLLFSCVILTILADSVFAINNSKPHLRLQLYKDAINTDDTYIGFDANAKTGYYFNEDAPYFIGNGKISLSTISSDNIKLAINRLPLPKHSETIQLYVNATADGSYRLKMTEDEGIPAIYEVWLMDAYKKDSLDMRQNKAYTFNLLKADTNSFGSKRFSLIIRENPALAIHLLDFIAEKASDGAQISWKTENEYGYTNFTVERSADGGLTYDAINMITSDSLGTYSFLDKTPVTTGTDQYRLKIGDLNGAVSYSDVITLRYSNTNIAHNSINIYPNPASGIINFSIAANDVSFTNSTSQQTLNGISEAVTAQNTESASYGIKIISLAGVVIKTTTTNSQNWRTDISNLLPGTYIIQMIKNGQGGIAGKGTFIKL
ncbi:MAG TPA: T9SS type A sorting domain-containing protein [Mucilaginibacter sp.]|jgi:hypothetical protein